MKKLILFLFFLFCFVSGLKAQQIEWVHPTFPQCSAQVAITVANGNNILLFEKRERQFELVFKTKLNSYTTSGVLLWSKELKSDYGNYNLKDVQTDSKQNIYFTIPYIENEFEWDGIKYNINNEFQSYLIKLNKNGDLIKIQGIVNNKSYSYLKTFSLDDKGGVFVAGQFQDTLTLGNFTLIGEHQNGTVFIANSFISKINSAGNYEWVQKINSSSSIFDIESDPNGNMYILGRSYDTLKIGAFTRLLSGDFIAKVNNSGTIQWVKELGANTLNSVKVIIDNNENVYFTGKFLGNLNFGQFSLTTQGSKPYNDFISKIDANGNILWLNKIFKNDINYPSRNISDIKLVNNKLFLSGESNVNIELTNLNLPVHSSAYNGFVAVLDDQGNSEWGHTFYGEDDNSIANIAVDSSENIFISGYFKDSLQLGPFRLGNSIKYTTFYTCYGGFLAKLNKNSNTVSGNIFIDENNNGLKDNFEAGLPNIILSGGQDLFSASSVTGEYSAFLPIGSHTLSVPHPPKHYTVNPASHTANFTAGSQNITGKDFALVANANIEDASVSLTANTAARPGFSFTYHLTAQNKGTVSITDSITFKYDTSKLIFDSASIQPAYNQNGKIQWAYQLQPFKHKQITVYFRLKPTATLGDTLVASVSTNPISDVFVADNSETIQQVIVGSYDPNDKQVLQETITPKTTTAGEYLDYTIRFQNTGTDTAFTVVVQDSISSQLDLSSLQMVSASHSYQLVIMKGNSVSWRFNNILLADSNTNEAASHGFVRFKIKVKDGLKLGDKIENKAAIYFDYNEPIITNTAITKVSQLWQENNNQLVIYPNPTRSQATVQARLSSEFEKQQVEVRLVNVLGKKMKSYQLTTGQYVEQVLDVEGMVRGMYLIQVISGNEVLTERLVIE